MDVLCQPFHGNRPSHFVHINGELNSACRYQDTCTMCPCIHSYPYIIFIHTWGLGDPFNDIMNTNTIQFIWLLPKILLYAFDLTALRIECWLHRSTMPLASYWQSIFTIILWSFPWLSTGQLTLRNMVKLGVGFYRFIVWIVITPDHTNIDGGTFTDCGQLGNRTLAIVHYTWVIIYICVCVYVCLMSHMSYMYTLDRCPGVVMSSNHNIVCLIDRIRLLLD